METKAIEERLEELKQLFGQYDYEIGMVETEFQTRVEELRKELLAKRDTPIPNAAKVSQTFSNSLLFICVHSFWLYYTKSIDLLVLFALTFN